MAATSVEHSLRAEQQRIRRSAKRTSGRCRQPAATMLPWAGQQIAICSCCQTKLEGPEPAAPWCASNEVHPLEFKGQLQTVRLVIEARLLPTAETTQARRSLAARCFGELSHILRPRTDRGSKRRLPESSAETSR